MNTSTICNALNNYLFHNVWNEPKKNEKRTVLLNKLTSGSRTGSFKVSSINIKLPNINEPYYVYYVKKSQLDYKDFDLKPNTWKSVKEINNTKYFLSFINKGKLLYRDKIFLYHYQPSDDIFIIISKKMMLKINGSNHDFTATRLLVYYDWDFEDDIIYNSIIINTEADKILGWSYCLAPNTNIILNGVKKQNILYDDLQVGSYLEVIYDPNVKINFNIDLTTDTGKRVYHDTIDNKLYTICHIPKHLNDLNYLYTNNLVDIYVFAKNSEGVISSGLFLHSVSLKLKQITHNDFGIPEDLLTTYSTYIGSEEFILNIQFRNNVGINTLTRDKNYIDLLYRHTDTQILDFLEGNGISILNFWQANSLANSNYVKYMMSLPSYVNSTNINTFIDTFGYQYVLSLLTDNIRKFVFDRDVKYPFEIKKPSIYSTDSIYISLFINGHKIDNDLLTISNIDDNFYSVRVTDELYFPPYDSEIIIEMIDQISNNNISFTPISIGNSITMTNSNYVVYKENNISVGSVKGVDSSYIKYYTLVNTNLYQIDTVTDGKKYTFHSSLYNSKCIFVPLYGSYYFRKDITLDVNNKEPIYMELSMPLYNEAGVYVPIINGLSTKVYLNGKTLVENIDYKFIKYKYDNNICGTQIVVFNRSYISDISNLLEVIVSKNESDKDYKFFYSNEENSIENSFTWFDSISTVSIDGLQIRKAYNTNLGILIDVSHRSGGLIESSCVYPKQTKEYISTFQSDEADERYDLLVNYFNNIKVQNSNIITIPYPHKLYSLKATIILRDLINGNVSFTLDPDSSKMKDLISEYSYLDNIDIINDDIDKRFIDFYPCHSDLVAVNPTIYKLVDYISRLIIDDTLTYGGIE